MKKELPNLIRRLWAYISYRRRLQLMVLLLLTIASSIAEIISIGAVIPFLAVLTAPEKIYDSNLVKPVIDLFGIDSSANLLLPLTILFGIAIFLSGTLRLLLVWVNARFSLAVGAELSADIYRRTLYQPYITQVSRNSSELISALLGKTNAVIFGIIAPILGFLSASLILISILTALFVVDPQIALIACSGFGAMYFLIARGAKKRLAADSELTSRESNLVVKTLQEGLGGIRDVLLDGSQEVYCGIYKRADLSLRRAQASTIFISQSPRYAMETLGTLLIVALAFFLADKPNGVAEAIPKLGALALGAQRLLPALQQAYWAWATMQSSKASLDDILELLDQPLPDYLDGKNESYLSFSKEIILKDVSFRYAEGSPWILRNINLSIKKGDRIGFIGSTGSGKSTLIDVIMGLLVPTEGALYVDGEKLSEKNYRLWQQHIAHVPQAIFLADSTVQNNIAFGASVEQIDNNRVEEAAKLAQISETIKTWPKKYDAFVGERGVKLSGGQRQRIGIARALYKMADLIVFDEATSALDSDTEKEVMKAIDELSSRLTILIIAHRLSTLQNCNLIVELISGKIARIGPYQEVINNYQRV
jgi:ABC-type multidrug transport system fused ATPase/permease subunit